MRRNPDDDTVDMSDLFDDDPAGFELLDLTPDAGYEALLGEERADRVLGVAAPSPAQGLVREALIGGLGASQKLYAKIGEDLRKNKGLSRSDRVIYRDARRLLEQAWGLDAVRVAPARPAAYARVTVPQAALFERTAVPRLAVHRFSTRDTLRPGAGRTTVLAPGETYYGFDALLRAAEDYRKDLEVQIAAETAKIRKFNAGRGGITVESKVSRAEKKRADLERELAAFVDAMKKRLTPST